MDKKRIVSIMLALFSSINHSLVASRTNVGSKVKPIEMIVDKKLGKNKQKDNKEKSVNKGNSGRLQILSLSDKKNKQTLEQNRIVPFMPDWATYVSTCAILGVGATVAGYKIWKECNSNKFKLIAQDQNISPISQENEMDNAQDNEMEANVNSSGKISSGNVNGVVFPDVLRANEIIQNKTLISHRESEYQ